MKVIAGLGNPGDEYRRTRHNVGFEVLDELVRRHGLGFVTGPVEALLASWRRHQERALLVMPLTVMYASGEAIAGLLRFFKLPVADLLVVCDDVNLPLGRLRARATGTEGGHNGLRSVARHLGTTDYARLRIGVGRGDARRDLADHVLTRFDRDEIPGVEDAETRAANAVETWLDDGLAKVMNTFNRVEDNA
jgi:PTH1 family peptidyl-tRNA hydrolase